MTTKHTPGPWYTMGAGVYTGSDNLAHIATAHFYGVPGDPMANARLIAAAPDLLAALQTLMRADYERNTFPGFASAGNFVRATEAARAAIAKATGDA